jgi:hypothetical protein
MSADSANIRHEEARRKAGFFITLNRRVAFSDTPAALPIPPYRG